MLAFIIFGVVYATCVPAYGDHDDNKHDPVENVYCKERQDGSKPEWPLSCSTAAAIVI